MNLIDNDLYLNDVIRVASASNMDFSKLRNSNILITGAAGLICSFLVDVLMYRNSKYNDNIKIYLMDRDESRIKDRFNYYNLCSIDENNCNLVYIIQNVCDEFNFDVDFDYLIHGASNTHPKLYATDPVGTITTNVIGLNNILNYCISHKPKRVFMMSSVEIYGENKGNVDKFDENYLGYINCNTVRAGYPEGKRLCESLCQAYISQYDMDIVIARFSRVYGPTLLRDDSKAMSQFLWNAVNDENVVLKSEGTQLFSYIHMTDAVSAILTILIDGSNGEAYNVADDASNVMLKDVAKILANYNNRDVIFQLPDDVEKKGYSKATKAIMNSDKLFNIGWKPYYTIETGLKNTVNVMKDFSK